MADTAKARLQQPDGTYLRASKILKDTPEFASQTFLMQLAEGKAELDAIPKLAENKPQTPKTHAKAAGKKADAAD
jgi:hypothetical protein